MLIDLKNYINHARKHDFNIDIEKEVITELDKYEFDSFHSLKNFSKDEYFQEKITKSISKLMGKVAPQKGEILEYPNTFQKKAFFQICIIDTEEDLLRQISNLNSKYAKYIFRGVSESKYMMYNSFQRYWNTNRLFEKGIQYYDVIMKIVKEARNDKTFKKYFNTIGEKISDISILSFLQHYGNNTPLIDWSYNFDVALFFAINSQSNYIKSKEAIENYFSVYFIEENNLRAFNYKLDVAEIIENQFHDFLRQDGWDNEKFESIDKKHHIKSYIKKRGYNIVLNEFGNLQNLFTLPSVCFFGDKGVLDVTSQNLINNFNIINQEGVFLWSFHSYVPIEFLIKKIHRPHVNSLYPTNIKSLEINKKLIPVAKKYLEDKGIHEEYIFPNPKSIINQIVKECCA